MAHKLTEDQIRFLEENSFHFDEKKNEWWQFDGSFDRVLLVAGVISLKDDKIIFTNLITGEEKVSNKVPFTYTYGTAKKLLDASRDADSKNKHVSEAINMITSLTKNVAGYLNYKEFLFVLDWL